MATSRTYRHRLRFRKPTATTAPSGQKVRSYEDSFLRRGKVEELAGDVAEVNGQKKAAARFQIELPKDSEVDGVELITWKIVWLDSGQTINITRKWTDLNRRRPVTIIEGTLDR